MTTQTGAQYIIQCRQLGFSDQDINKAMQNFGWQPADIQVAFLDANSPAQTVLPKKSNPLLWIILGVVVLLLLVIGGVTIWLLTRQ